MNPYEEFARVFSMFASAEEVTAAKTAEDGDEPAAAEQNDAEDDKARSCIHINCKCIMHPIPLKVKAIPCVICKNMDDCDLCFCSHMKEIYGKGSTLY